MIRALKAFIAGLVVGLLAGCGVNVHHDAKIDHHIIFDPKPKPEPKPQPKPRPWNRPEPKHGNAD